MWPLLIPAIGLVADGVVIVSDWFASRAAAAAGEESVSYLQAFFDNIRYGASVSEFFSECWPIVVGGVLVVWLAVALAVPGGGRPRRHWG